MATRKIHALFNVNAKDGIISLLRCKLVFQSVKCPIASGEDDIFWKPGAHYVIELCTPLHVSYLERVVGGRFISAIEFVLCIINTVFWNLYEDTIGGSLQYNKC